VAAKSRIKIESNFPAVKRAGWETVTEARELWLEVGQSTAQQKVESQADDLRAALGELFGVQPRIRCIVREAAVGPHEVTVVEEEETPSEEEALKRLQEQLGAQVSAEPKAD
jgi:hypothetical protein